VATEFRLKARAAVDEHVLAKWINEVVTSGDEWVRCSELLANYGYGKPSQAIEMSGEDGNPLGALFNATLEQLLALAAKK